MAQPIPLELPERDPRAALQTRLQNAPAEHAEALLAVYEVLQALHNRGVFDLLRGAIVSGDKVAEIVVDTVNKPEFIVGIRNVMTLTKILGSVEPELLEGFARSLPEAIAYTKAHEAKPPGVLGVLVQFGRRDFRRGLILVNSLLESFGRNLPHEAVNGQKPPP
jgi:uncharacterized protein YjgD (DUF1641 family)